MRILHAQDEVSEPVGEMVDHVEGDEPVDGAQPLQEDAPALARQVEHVRRPVRERCPLPSQDLGGNTVARADELLVEEALRRLNQPRPRPLAEHERASSLGPSDQTLLLEAREGLPDGGARDAVVVAEVGLGRYAPPRVPPSARDLVLEELCELEVERDR